MEGATCQYIGSSFSYEFESFDKELIVTYSTASISFFRLNFIIKEIKYNKITVSTWYYHEIWVYAENKTFDARGTRAKM